MVFCPQRLVPLQVAGHGGGSGCCRAGDAGNREKSEYDALATFPRDVPDAVVRGIRRPPAEAADMLTDQDDLFLAPRLRRRAGLFRVEPRGVHLGKVHLAVRVVLLSLPGGDAKVYEHLAFHVHPLDLPGCRPGEVRRCRIGERLGEHIFSGLRERNIRYRLRNRGCGDRNNGGEQ